MDFSKAVYMDVELKRGERKILPSHITNSIENEILSGANVLEKLGVENKFSKRMCDTDRIAIDREMVAADRTFIPPHVYTVIKVQCEGMRGRSADCVVWPCIEGIPAGVFKLSNQQSRIPVLKKSDQPLISKSRKGWTLGNR